MGKNKSNDLQAELQKLLAEGTPRQKALFLCRNWYEPRSLDLYGEKPRITEEESKTVVNSLQGNKAKAAFRKWMNYYYQYSDLIQLLGLGVAEYQRAAKELVGYLRMWDMHDNEGNIINSIYLEIKEKRNKEQTSSFEDMVGRNAQPTQYAKLARRTDGSFYFDVTDLYENYIKPTQKNVRAAYSALKALVEVLEGHIQKNNSGDFVPSILRRNMDDAKKGYKAFNLKPRYSYEELRKRKEDGETITDDDEKRAVFPDYETLPVNPDIKVHFEQVVKNRERLV